MALPRLTLLGRSVLLMVSELAVNAVCWIVAGILFGKRDDTRSILDLALLAWTLGLRHGLDADHISAIDNATRGLLNLGQLSVTCGLFFSLGHSTVVIAVNVAIAISSNVYNRIGGVGRIGGIVGDAVSGSFLFIIGLANSIILWKIMKRRGQEKIREQRRMSGETVEDPTHDHKENNMLMMRVLGPVVKFVDRPWKMYPVGVLFGFGFDTASSIALLAVSALARKGADGSFVPSSHIVVLPFLFTAGMTIVDSADSVMMLYSYSGFPERSFFVLEKGGEPASGVQEGGELASDTQLGRTRIGDPEKLGIEESKEGVDEPPSLAKIEDAEEFRVEDTGEGTGEQAKVGDAEKLRIEESKEATEEQLVVEERTTAVERNRRVKLNVMSGLSVTLTFMSILVAFSISLIVLMGLIGDNCEACIAAAGADGGRGGGLAGRWWRGWANANDKSGYIGVGIVGGFLFVVVGWYGSRWVARKAGGGS